MTLPEARGFISKHLPSAAGGFDNPAPAGCFYLLASKGGVGSFLGALPVAPAGADLPPVTMLSGPGRVPWPTAN
jgi:hypothetical protein